MKRLILIGLTLAAFAPSARAEPVKASVQPPSAQARDLAKPNRIELPVARRAIELPASDAPNIVLAGDRLLVDGDAAGSIQEAREASSPKKLDELFSSLEVLRERWKMAHPDAEFPGVAVLWLDRSTPAFVTKSVFQTAAFAGYPNLIFAVRREDGRLAALHADASVPGPPVPLPVVPRADAFTLHVEHRKDGAIFLVWKDGNVMLNQRETAEAMSPRGFLGLARIITEEWQAYGGHRTRHDVAMDRAVLHVEDTLGLDATVALIDAIDAPERESGDGNKVAAFNVVFAIN